MQKKKSKQRQKQQQKKKKPGKVNRIFYLNHSVTL